MNYFNYFTEIEDAFIRRRGKHLFLSPMDWALIESWKGIGVPLHVALSGIERAFDSFESKPRRRSVKSLMYCQEEVEAQYAEWLESQLGAGPEPDDSRHTKKKEIEREAHLPFPRTVILNHLSRTRTALNEICDRRKKQRNDNLCDTLARVAARLRELEEDFSRARRPDAERLEDALTNLEKILNEALRSSIPADELATARAETEGQLQPYRDRMEQATYEQTLDNLLLKRLRDRCGAPRLSLFYL